MNVLVIGSGGREHALAWRLAQSKQVTCVYGLPGNPGMAEVGTCLKGSQEDPAGVAALIEEKKIDLTVIGPEAPLVAGLAEDLRSRGHVVFGPGPEAALLEGSKVFAKSLMMEYGIPTASFEVFGSPRQAISYASEQTYPLVIKADGLAAGKGVIIARDRGEARQAIDTLMVERRFGDAGNRVVIEEFLEGQEVSVFVVAAGTRYTLLPSSQDFKRAFDEDRGPNTGGMGAYAPAVGWTPELETRVRSEIVEPVLRALVEKGRPYHGLLYVGLVLRDEHPRVLEFNCRFGDPETQAVLPIVEGDLLEVLSAATRDDGRPLPGLKHDGRAAVCVVLASGGYPERYDRGMPIAGLEEARKLPGVLVFHAGTAVKDGILQTAGGRVLNVVGVADDIAAAARRSYEGASLIRFDRMHLRRDIAKRAVERMR